jgi:hypothetical protein
MVVVGGLVVAAGGFALAANLLGLADEIARWGRAYPSWMQTPYSGNPIAVRVIGAGFMIGGLVIVAFGLR